MDLGDSAIKMWKTVSASLMDLGDAAFHDSFEFKHEPKHLLLNKLPVSPKGEYYTLQNTGTAFCPNRVLHQTGLVQNLGSLGYQVVDVSTNPGMPLRNRTRKAIRSVPFPGCISGYNHRIKTERSCRDKGKRDVTRNAVHTLSRRLPGSVRFTHRGICKHLCINRLANR